MSRQDEGPAVPSKAATPASSERSLVTDLSRPTAYPPPLPTSVTLMATHASWVFLTEGEAWKIKRPVNYGFLDYSDAAKRRQSCEDEVRLGERLAPGIYRGVEPVFSGPDGFTFVGPGPVVDTAVRMTRLPDAENALSLVRVDRLTPAHLRTLCERLALFYRTTERTDGYGGPATLAAAIEQNYEQTLPFAGRYVGEELLDRLHHAQRQAVAEAAGWLKQRVLEGRIRDGHGDLRLEHIYFLSAREFAPVVIDPIEFNPAFRCQDAALDLAFLAMELEAEGRHDLGVYVLSRFASAANDYRFFPLADLYLGHRAWVRAKIACFVAADPQTPPEKGRRKAAEAAKLFALAESFTRPRPRTGIVLAVGGMIATGKSTAAEALGLALAVPVISSDETRKALAGLPALTPGGADLYDPAFTDRTYAEVFGRAEAILDSKRDVILDATFGDPRHRRDARALARRHGLRFVFVALDADDDTLRARLRARAEGSSVSDARAELLPALRRRYEPPIELPPDEILAIDGRQPSDVIVSIVSRRVTSIPPPTDH